MPSRTVRAPDATALHVVEEGPADGPVAILLHGFPELGFSWRHQIPVLSRAGWRVLTPDLRGFGLSGAPESIEAYAIDVLAGDVLALMDDVGARRSVLIGHDWGAEIAWKTAWMHPDRVAAVAGLSVPFVPRSPAPPLQILRHRLGEEFYIVWFQRPGAAEAALSRDVRRTLATTELWSARWAERVGERPPTPRFMTDAELSVYVEAFERTGFSGGLAYYRNINRNWQRTAHLEGRRIQQPALFICGERDPVRRFMPAQAMEGWVTDLRGSVVVAGAGHWVNQEAPAQVNRALLEWLEDLGPAGGAARG